MSRVLESEGVKVRRPDEFDYAVEQSVFTFERIIISFFIIV